VHNGWQARLRLLLWNARPPLLLDRALARMVLAPARGDLVGSCLQAPRDATRADSGTLAQREAIRPDATNGSGPRPDTFDVSMADVRSHLEGAGIGPEVGH